MGRARPAAWFPAAVAAAFVLAGCAAPPAPADALDAPRAEGAPAPPSAPVPVPTAPPPTAPIPPSSPPPRLRLAAPVIVDSEGGSGEPSLLLAPDGRVFVAAPLGSTNRADALWVSPDGHSFGAATTPDYPFGGGDTDLALDAAGTLYMVGQWTARARVPAGTPSLPTGEVVGWPFPFCESVSSSTDGGVTWTTNPVACLAAGSTDRAWLDTFGAGTLYMGFNQFPSGLFVVKSTDSGLTWVPMDFGGTAKGETFTGVRGNLATDKRNGTVYVAAVVPGSGPHVWVSDGTGPFELHRVAETPNDVSNLFNIVSVGQDGTVFQAWSEDFGDDGHAVMMAHSTDGGRTWSSPVKVSAGRRTAIFPWVAAGDAGRVAVAWYATDAVADPGEVPADAAWHAYLAVSTDALSETPTFLEAQATRDLLHRGPVCVFGTGCDPATRRLLDFFELAIGPDGRAALVVADDSRGPDQPVLNHFIRQAEGPLLLAPREA